MFFAMENLGLELESVVERYLGWSYIMGRIVTFEA